MEQDPQPISSVGVATGRSHWQVLPRSISLHTRRQAEKHGKQRSRRTRAACEDRQEATVPAHREHTAGRLPCHSEFRQLRERPLGRGTGALYKGQALTRNTGQRVEFGSAA
eukprot:5312331-Pyramimonas_sp.AAC.1